MRQWILIATLIVEVVVLHYSGSPASVAIFWKMTGWGIVICFAGGVLALPCYSLNLILSALGRRRPSARQALYWHSLGLTLGVTFLLLFLRASAYG